MDRTRLRVLPHVHPYTRFGLTAAASSGLYWHADVREGKMPESAANLRLQVTTKVTTAVPARKKLFRTRTSART